MSRRVRSLLLVVALAVVATACRVDVNVDVTMQEDGTGVITVAAVADADVVNRAPSIATDLRFADLQAAGWTVEGPIPTQAGGIQVRLTHEFATPGEATTLLGQLSGPNGPFTTLALKRSVADRTTTFTINGQIGVTNGLEAFSDEALTAAVGASPYSDQVAALSVQPGDVIGITLTASLPGTVEVSTADTAGPAGAPKADGLRWAVPFDGSVVDIATTSQVVEEQNTWIRPLASGLKIAVFAWIMLSLLGVAYVLLLRRRQRIENQPWY